ncbi:zinc finger BED domain-containing protein RICESLEEPER 1-like [Morus notabilis]|uniref:zinc finger BED domain-containing protein RICESLEEPER 1-like n=1 Tax=Morus notabilis TaxID=981085 RepID=UPI000CED29AD|nr:zinc finger BED domain-containing protein RICESLEEPER 1-like [Morus notabilis]
MLKHIKTCLRLDTRDIGQMLISRDSSLSFGSCSFNSEKWRELMTVCIVMHDLPFQFVEYKGLRAMLQYLYPDVELVSRNTAKVDSLKLYAREKIKIKNMLDACPGRISLTSDMWTSLTTYGYWCMTAHFLDKNWKLHKRILSFCLMPPPHTGIALSEKIFSLLSDWGIEEKIFSITLDNAASNDVSVDALLKQLNLRGLLPFHGEFFQLRCCAHILNLVVQDGLKSIDKLVEKIRDSVKYVKGSQQRKQKFLECVKLVSMGSNKGLSQDVVTRWNSTYLMLESIALVFDPRYKTQFIDFCYKKAFELNSKELLSLRAKLESLFHEYALKLDHYVSPPTCKKKDKGKAPYGMEVDESDLMKLELYLDEPRIKRSYQLDILSYWKRNQCRYPILAAMARDLLCILVSTVASEAAFSVGSCVLDQFRSSLKHETVEAIVCTRDWLYGNEGIFFKFFIVLLNIVTLSLTNAN